MSVVGAVNPGRGMRLVRIAAFVAMGLALHALFYQVYVRIGREHKAVRSDIAFLVRAPPRISLLVCGDSHPRTAIDAQILGNGVFNVAIGGEHYLKTWYRMRALVERGARQVDALLLPLDAGSFSSWHAENFAPEYVWGRYVDFLEVGRVRHQLTGESLIPYAARALKAQVVPYAGELRTLNQLRTKRFGFGEDLPFGSFGALSIPDRRATALQQAKEHFDGAEIIDPGLKWAFDNLVQWAADHHVKLVLVAFPTTRWYDRWVTRLGVRARMQREVLEPLLADPNVVYLDHHADYADRDDFFSDPHHLNMAGRTAFSRRLAAELRERGILSGPTGQAGPADDDG